MAIKVITAINNPELNERLNKENNIEIICKDIQYKEAIIEILEENKFVDLIIINENLPGQILIEDLIKEIKNKQNEINILIILEKQNKQKELILNKQGIFDIYYNNKININELIKIINKKNLNVNDDIKKEIENLKKIISEKNIQKDKIKNKINIKIKKIFLENFKKIKIIKYYCKNNIKINTKNQIITISGSNCSGKSTFTLNLSNLLKFKFNKILLIDFNNCNKDIYTILGKKLTYNNLDKKNSEKIINNSYIYNIVNKNIIKINKKIFLLSNVEQILKNNKDINIKKILLNLNKKYDFILFDLGQDNANENIVKEILYISNKNIIMIEGNLLSIKKTKKIIDKYINNFNIKKQKINIIINKYNKKSISEEIIKICFPGVKLIGKIKYSFIYQELINKNYIVKNEFEKNKIKKEIKNIANQI